MTAIGDKLKQAGVDTLGVEFYSRAVESLKATRSVRDAWRMLGETWGHVTLTRIWTDMRGPVKEQSKLGDRRSDDTPRPNVSQGKGSGHGVNDTQERAAAALPASPKSKPFFKQKGKSQADKVIAQSARLAGSSIWKDLKMDRLRYHELDAFIRGQIIAGAGHARKAHFETKRAAVAWLVKQHGIPADPNALMKDCVSEKDAVRFGAMGERQAGLIVAKLVEQGAAEIASGVKLIAAE